MEMGPKKDKIIDFKVYLTMEKELKANYNGNKKVNNFNTMVNSMRIIYSLTMGP